MRIITPAAAGTTDSGAAVKSILIYGETQSGKTSLIGSMARAVFEKTGKITRLIMADEGGISAIAPEVNEGIIQVVSMVADELPQSNLMWLAKGHMPDPVTGVINTKAPDLRNVGMLVLDSLSSAAALVLNFFVQKGLKVGQDVVALRSEQGLSFGNASLAHYGSVQQFMLQLITQFNGLPVDRVIFTALESRGQDIVDQAVVLGPLVTGKALTGIIPSRINRILHLELVPTADRKDRVYRIYFRPHVDPVLNRLWPANLRLPLEANVQMKKHSVYGSGYIEFETGVELLALFEYCDTLVEGMRKKVVEVKETPMPGPPPTTTGSASTAIPTQTPAQKVAALANTSRK